MNQKRGIFTTSMMFGTLAFFYIPLSLLVLFSFNSSKTTIWEGFSLRWFNALFFQSPALWEAFGKSLLIAVLASLFATIIGSLGAIGLFRYQIRFKKTIYLATFLPLLLPEIIMGVSLLIFFSKMGITLGLPTIFVAHTTFCIPYVFLIMMARLDELDPHIIEAAYDLGAKEWSVLTKVILPMCYPAIIASLLVSATLSLEDFVITFFVAGPGSTTLPLYIYSMIRFGVSPVINALSVVLIFGTVILAASTSWLYKYIIK